MVGDGELLATVTRSGDVESVHTGSLVVVAEGSVRLAIGDPRQLVFCRSAVKPLQALPLVERGVAARLELGLQELALTSASHNGTDAHTAVAAAILARGGLVADDLLCGPHAPFDRPASRAITAAGGKPQKIHNNCSGKHAGFLLLAADMGVAKADYLDPECASQVLIRRTVAEMAGLAPDALTVGLDGCGAPTFRLPLENLAAAFANLTNPVGLAPVRAGACRTMLEAITKHPAILAGEGRLCTALIRSAPGRIYCKNGAEGVYAFGLPGRGVGVAIKIDDGSERGYLPVVVDLLRELSLWPDVPDRLREFHRVPVRNTQKVRVGEVSSAVEWPSTLRP
jgi:L-asparaginase II